MIQNNNTVSINGDTFYYKTSSWRTEYGSNEQTEFYKKEIKTFKIKFLGLKFLLQSNPVVLFEIRENIENPKIQKDRMKEMVIQAYEEWIRIELRKSEISKGYLI